MEKRRNAEGIIAGMVSLLMALIQGFASPLHPWIHGELNVDSGVFQTVALMMEHGYMPYRDTFDHKGPYLYILNWLGRRLGDYCGVWYVEVVTIAVTIFFMYKTARLVSSTLSSLVATMVGLALLNNYIDGGNYCEEYAMPLIAIGTFIFADYCLNKVISNVRLIISGACFGLVLMLRPNMFTLWLVYCLTIFAAMVISQKWQELGHFVLCFTLGMAIVGLPVILWLGVNNDLRACIDSYLMFNIKYSVASPEEKFSAFSRFFFSVPCVVASVCIIIKGLKEKNRFFNLSYFVYLALSFYFISMSGRDYSHYGLVLVPAVVYPIASVLGEIEAFLKRYSILTALWLVLLAATFIPSWMNLVIGIPHVYADRNESHLSREVNDVYEVVYYMSDEFRPISVYGNWDTIYVLTGRTHATKYSFQVPIAEVDPSIFDEYLGQLQEELPQMIVVYCQHRREEMNQFLAENGYEMCYAANPEDPSHGPSVWRLLY